MDLIEKYERILFGAKQALRENDCKFIRESICEYETILAALRAYKPTAEEAAEIDKTIDELKRLRIALATSRCDGKRVIDMLSPAIEIITDLRKLKGSEGGELND